MGKCNVLKMRYYVATAQKYNNQYVTLKKAEINSAFYSENQ